MYDFPRFSPSYPTPSPDKVWDEKIALDLSAYQTEYMEISDLSSTILLFPHIEEGRKSFVYNSIKNKSKAARLIFENISQKIAETFILYDKVPVVGFEEDQLASKRYNTVRKLVLNPSISHIASILTNPKKCWGDLLN